MKEGFVRKPSGLEAFFIDLDQCGCNMTFHFYLKLDKRPCHVELNDVMRQMIDTHKGINMKFYRNAWYSSSYIPECRVLEVEGNGIENYEPSRLDFHSHTVALNILHVTQNDVWYLCFDFFHGVADGMSGVQFVYDFFDLLNGRRLPQIAFTVSEGEQGNRREWSDGRPDFTVFPKCQPLNWITHKEGEARTAILRCERSIHYAAARFSEVIGKYFVDKSAKMIIPVNIRRYTEASAENNALFGNLFVPMLLDVKSYSSWEGIHKKIIDSVKRKPLLMAMAKKFNVYRKFPTKLRQFVIRKAIPIVMRNKKFIYCALVSTLGRIDSERLMCDAFKVVDYNVTFESFPFTAFSIITLQFNENANTSVSWHSGRVPEKIAENLVRDIAGCLDRHELIEQG